MARYEKWAHTHAAGTGGWQFACLDIGVPDVAWKRLSEVIELAERSEPDAGFIAFMILMNNVRDDTILEEFGFQKPFGKIDTIARSR